MELDEKTEDDIRESFDDREGSRLSGLKSWPL